MFLGKPIRGIHEVIHLRLGITLGTARHFYGGLWISSRRLHRESPARSHYRGLLLRGCLHQRGEGQAGKQGAKQILHSVLRSNSSVVSTTLTLQALGWSIRSRPFRAASGCSCEVPKARGDANPFISKDDVDRFMTVHIECGEAQLAWAKGD